MHVDYVYPGKACMLQRFKATAGTEHKGPTDMSPELVLYNQNTCSLSNTEAPMSVSLQIALLSFSKHCVSHDAHFTIRCDLVVVAR